MDNDDFYFEPHERNNVAWVRFQRSILTIYPTYEERHNLVEVVFDAINLQIKAGHSTIGGTFDHDQRKFAFTFEWDIIENLGRIQIVPIVA